MSHQNTPRPNKCKLRNTTRSNPSTPKGTFMLENPPVSLVFEEGSWILVCGSGVHGEQNKTVWSSNVRYGEREIEDGHLWTIKLKPFTFKYHHCWEILKDCPKWKQSELPKFAAESGGGSKRYKSSGSSSFNTESREASINLNTNVGDNDEDEPYGHLTKEQRMAIEEARAEFKAKYKLPY
ncbi:hypothetical protein Tco_0737596 [Tanacetum coccineum]